MWTCEHDSNVHWDGEDEMYWEYFTINDENGNEVARCDDEKTARLIVTVPELLAALQKLCVYAEDVCGVCPDDCHEEHPLMSAQAAISKALGETK